MHAKKPGMVKDLDGRNHLDEFPLVQNDLGRLKSENGLYDGIDHTGKEKVTEGRPRQFSDPAGEVTPILPDECENKNAQ